MSDEPDRPAGELRIRAAEVVGVNYPERTIELIVVPYESEAVVSYGQRRVRESIARGAFDGIERRANRIRVNRDHQLERTVGRAVAFHPSRDEGLVADVRIARTPLGDETLELAEEGCLDASAGFLPMPGGEHWTDHRSRVRIVKAWLGHIAMTPDPAYEGANVLAVRAAAAAAAGSARPNLEAWKAIRLADRVASDELYR